MQNPYPPSHLKIFFLFVLLLLSKPLFAQVPAITSFSPSSGAVGTSVTISGANFNTTPSNNIVFFGANMGAVTAASATSLTVTVPAGASYQNLSVTNLTTGLTAYSSKPFTVTYSNGVINHAAKVDLTTGTNAWAVAISDLDGDGKADLVVTNFTSNTISVFRNTSSSGSITSSSFAAKVDFTTGTNPVAIVVGDLDGDGKPDIVVANQNGVNISVFRNTSTSGSITASSFAAKIDLTTGTTPFGVAIADLDGDGKPEIAVANAGSASVSVFRNTSTIGDITASSFAAKSDYTTGSSPHGIVIADLDGDGKPDLALPNQNSNTMSVLRNTSTTGTIGVGSFATKVDFITGLTPNGIAVGDLDGDGKPELVVSNYGGASVSVFQNTSTSGSITATSFAAKVDFTAGTNPRNVAIADMDGDGKADLVAENVNSNSVSIFRNTSASGSISTGSFATKSDFTTGSAPENLAIGDLDGDGKADIVTANYTSSTISVLRNMFLPLTITSFSPSSGAAGSSITITGARFNSVANSNIVFFGSTMGTVTAASATSLTVTVPYGASYQNISVTDLATGLTAYSLKPFAVTYSNGIINQAPKVDLTTGTNAWAVAISDFDGDGKPDLVVTNFTSNTISIFRNTSTSGSIASTSFAAKVDFVTGTNPVAVAVGDLDGDGKPDIAVANQSSGTVSVFRNTSTSGSITSASFATKVDLTTGTTPFGVAIADLDADGKPEIAVPNAGSTTVSIFHNTSVVGNINTNSFAAKVDYATGSSPHGIAIGDLDGDGKPDLVIPNQNSSTVSVLRNTSVTGIIGAGSFATKVDFAAGLAANGVAIGDLDGDGKPEIAVSNYSANSISVYQNTSTTGAITTASFAAKIDLTTAANPRNVAIADMDGDGKADLVSSNVNGNSVSVFRNIFTSGTIATSSFAAKSDFTTGSAPENLAIGDLDGDGKADIAAANYNSSSVSILRNAFNSVNLSALSTSAGTLVPGFSSSVLAYAISVGNATSSVTVSPEAAGTNALIQVRVNGGTYATVNGGNASAALALAEGANTIDVKVTADDASATKIYTITITRASSPTVTSFTSTTGTVSGNNLVDLPVLGGVTITITGTNFLPGMTISSGANGAITVVSATSATFTLAAGVQGTTLTPTVTTTDATSVAGASLTYASVPTITSFASTDGTASGNNLVDLPITGGSTITITGTNFFPGMTISGGANDALNVTSSTSATFTLAAGGYGTTITPAVTSLGGTSAASVSLTYLASATIATSGTLTALTTTYGTPSASATFNVSGTHMAAGILATAPSAFELSTDNTTFTNTVTVGAAGTIVSTPIYIRLKGALDAGSYSGNVVLTSSGATTVNLATVSSTVSPTALTVTANNASKTYGSSLTNSTSSVAFTSTGLVNSETIGSVSLTYGAASAVNAAVGSYTGQITPSLATGGTFKATNYNITYVKGDITVGQAGLVITATGPFKLYGDILTTGSNTTNFTATGLVNGETISNAILTPDAAGISATTAAGVSYAVVPSAASGSITASNYSITYNSFSGTVAKAPLTITANNVVKTVGTTLTGSTGSSLFTTTGLVNGESVGTVTVAYGIGAAANDAVATYPGSVVVSAATGGSFTASNYNISYAAGNITVTATPLPIISTSGSLSALSTTYGTASASASFNVSGVNMTAGILITPPTGYEVSASSTTGFGSSVTIGSAGTIASTPVYIRLAATTAKGTYSGNVVLSSNGANAVNQATTSSTVNALNLTITASNASKIYGTTLTGASSATAFTSTILANSETIGSVTLAYGAGASATSVVGTFTGSVIPSAATGGTFTPNNYNITYATGDIAVTPAALIITANNASKTYGSTLTGTAGSSAFIPTGLANGETIGSITVAYGTGATATANVATYTAQVTPSVAIGGTFTASNYTITYAKGDIVVNPASLNVTANNVSKTYGAILTGGAGSTAFTTSGLANGETITSVTIAYNGGSAANASVNTYSGSVVPSVAAGTFTAANYNMTYVAGNINVNPAALTIAASNLSKTYGAALTSGTISTGFVVTGLANSETVGSVSAIYGTGSAANAVVATYNNAITLSSATGGTFTAGNYNITYTQGNIIITPAVLIVTAGSVSKSYGAANPALSVNYIGFAGADNIASLTSPATVTTVAVANSPVGIYNTVASGASSANYTFTYVTGKLTVTPATLTVTANNATKNIGNAITGGSGSTAFTTSGLVLGETVGTITITYGNGSAVSATPGTYTGAVVASLLTGGTFTPGNYNITYIAGNIVVTQNILTITVNNISKVYGSANPTLTLSYSGFLGTDNASNLGTQPIVVTTATSASGVGAYPITVSGAASTNYVINYVQGTLTVNPAPLNIAADNKSRAYGTANPAFTITYNGFVGADNQSSLATLPTVSSTSTVASLPGTFPIVASGAAASNYNITYTAGTLTVTPLTISTLTNLTVDQGTLSPAFTSTGYNYTVSVSTGVERIVVTPTISDATATARINGGTSNTITLSYGYNTIIVLVTAQDGVTKNAYVITVYRAVPPMAVAASNILSPNGDGKNDSWVIKDIQLYPNNEVTVYDRAGRVVFAKHGYANTFDGSLKGAPLAEGTYYYTIDLGQGSAITKGFITILRSR